jgi:hypothetical protein
LTVLLLSGWSLAQAEATGSLLEQI